MDWVGLLGGLWLMFCGLVAYITVNKRKQRQSKSEPKFIITHELQWEPVAIADEADIRVLIQRGKQSILIGETSIHAADFSKIVESLNTTALTRAMEMNSMAIKWEGDTGTMVPTEVAERYKQDRDNFAKHIKQLEASIDNILSPDGFASMVELYLRKVSPTSEVGTIRVMNNGHPIAEIPPDPNRPRLQGPVGWQYGVRPSSRPQTGRPRP